MLINNLLILFGNLLLFIKVEINLPRDGENAHDDVSDNHSFGIESIIEFDGSIDVWCLTHVVTESALGLYEFRISIDCAVGGNLKAARMNWDVKRLRHVPISVV